MICSRDNQGDMINRHVREWWSDLRYQFNKLPKALRFVFPWLVLFVVVVVGFFKYGL